MLVSSQMSTEPSFSHVLMVPAQDTGAAGLSTLLYRARVLGSGSAFGRFGVSCERNAVILMDIQSCSSLEGTKLSVHYLLGGYLW